MAIQSEEKKDLVVQELSKFDMFFLKNLKI